MAYWLKNYETLEALAESPSTARGLLSRKDGPTPAEPKTARNRGHHSDPLRWSVVVADLQKAHIALKLWGLEARIVHALMYDRIRDPKGRGFERQPTIAELRDAYHLRNGDVYAAWRSACKHMAEHLGWTPPPEDPEATDAPA